MARPKRYNKPKQISIRLDEKLLEALDRRSTEIGIDRSQLINKILSLNVESNPFEPQKQKAEDESNKNDFLAAPKENGVMRSA